MGYPSRVVLVSRSKPHVRLEELVEDLLRDRVRSIAVVGEECARIEDAIDELIVGDASDDSRFAITTSHPNETLPEVIAFARAFGSFIGLDRSEEQLVAELS